jgi:hypothetical protein
MATTMLDYRPGTGRNAIINGVKRDYHGVKRDYQRGKMGLSRGEMRLSTGKNAIISK